MEVQCLELGPEFVIPPQILVPAEITMYCLWPFSYPQSKWCLSGL